MAAALVVAMAAFGAGALDALRLPQFTDADSESARTAVDLRDAAGADVDPGLAVLVRGPEAGVQRALPHAERVLREDPGIGRVLRLDPLAVGFLRSLSEDDAREATERVRERIAALSPPPGVELLVGGRGAAFSDTTEQVEHDLVRAELIAFPLLAVALVIVFGGLVAALVPLVLGGAAVLAALAMLRAIDLGLPVAVTSLNVASALGLGLAVDYSLFVVSRFREELARGADVPEALATTLRTAGRTVLFSSLTVAVALASLCLFPQRFLYSMGIGGALVALFAGLGALTAVPAALALLGRRIDAGRIGAGRVGARLAAPRDQGRGRLHALAHAVQRRPVGVLAVAAGALLALSAPALGLRTTGIDTTVLPDEAPASVVRAALPAPGAYAPVDVAIAGAADAPAVRALTERLARRGEVAVTAPPRRLGPELTLVQLLLRAPPLSEEATGLVHEVRALDSDRLPIRVAGRSAELVDFRASVKDRLPLVVAVLAATTLALLFALTGSLLLPLASLVLNALTAAATLGALVLLFQHGGGDPIELSISLLVLAVAFGLSTDYGVFLLARVKELRDAGVPAREAVAQAVQRTSGLITAAAALFVIAVGALVTSPLVFLDQAGLGSSIAVALDATIVRLLLVPAILALGGGAAWWAPRALRRLHAQVRLLES